MNDILIGFLSRIDTKTATVFEKVKNDKGVDGVATNTRDKAGIVASIGWCVVDAFPTEKFQMIPSELKKLLEMGRNLTIEDNMMVAEDQELGAKTYWGFTPYQKESSIVISYTEPPIILPKNVIQMVAKTSDFTPKMYTFTVKENILTIRADYSTSDKNFVNSNDHTSVRVPVSGLADGERKFDGGSMATLFGLLNDNTELMLTFVEGKPSRLTQSGEGFIIHHYIMPIELPSE